MVKEIHRIEKGTAQRLQDLNTMSCEQLEKEYKTTVMQEIIKARVAMMDDSGPNRHHIRWSHMINQLHEVTGEYKEVLARESKAQALRIRQARRTG